MPRPPSVNGLLTGDTCQRWSSVNGLLIGDACQRWPARQRPPPSEIYTGAHHPTAATHTPCNIYPALSQTLSSWRAEFLDTISLENFKTFVVFLKLFLHRKSAWSSVNSTSDLTWFLFFCHFLLRNNFKLYSLPGWYKELPYFFFFFLTFCNICFIYSLYIYMLFSFFLWTTWE